LEKDEQTILERKVGQLIKENKDKTLEDMEKWLESREKKEGPSAEHKELLKRVKAELNKWRPCSDAAKEGLDILQKEVTCTRLAEYLFASGI
jgi:hypothetical protein